MLFPLADISSDNKNLIAFVVCTAILGVLNKIRDKKNDAKNAEVLKTTADTNDTVKKVYKLTDGHLGALKRAVAISAETNANSLRLLANKDDDSDYAKQADAAELVALKARQDADDHDARLAQLDEEIKLRQAEISAVMPGNVKAAEKVAEVTADAAAATKAACVITDQAADAAAVQVQAIHEAKEAGKVQEKKEP